MKVILQLGKVVVVLFWLVALANLVSPWGKPFDQLLLLCAGLMLLAHLVELVLFDSRLKGRPQPWRDRAQVLLFGVLHLLSLPPSRAKGARHA